MICRSPPPSPGRRALLVGSGGLVALRVLPVRAEAGELPPVPELVDYLAGRAPRFGRLVLDIPRLADNGNAVPLRIRVTGLFEPGAALRSVRLYSPKNPVALMARFDFPVAPARAEIDTRVRLAGTQRIVGVAELADGELHAAVADVEVTVSACLDGS